LANITSIKNSHVSKPFIIAAVIILFVGSFVGSIIMILGIEYKTLPSFLGFIRPRKMADIASFILASSCVTIGLASSIMLAADFLILHLVFNIILLISAATFATSIYALGGFDNTEILRVIQ
jgi:hypothetical protein